MVLPFAARLKLCPFKTDLWDGSQLSDSCDSV